MRTRAKNLDNPNAKIKSVEVATHKPLEEGPIHTCGACGMQKHACEWQALINKWVCMGCAPKLQAKRIEMMTEAEIKALEEGIILDEQLLKDLKADGLPPRWYLFLALLIEGVDTQQQDIDVQAVCDRWGISREDLIGEVAKMSKKGMMHMELEHLKASLYTRQDRLRMLERAINGDSNG